MTTKKRKTTKNSVPETPLLSAMRFLSLCQSEAGKEIETHCTIGNGCAVAFDGVIAMGTLVDTDLEACPHTLRLALALAQCGENYAIVEGTGHALQVRSDAFMGFVPVCDPEKLLPANPDVLIAALSDSLKDALKVVSPLAGEKELVVTAAIHLYPNSVLATNREVVLESWHNHDLPAILIPKAAATALIKSNKPLVGFGVSDRTATFWFEDQSWLRTQLFKENVPDLREMLNVISDARAIPAEFFAAIKRVAAFSDNGKVYCYKDSVCSHNQHMMQTHGGKFENVQGGFAMRSYNAKALLSVAKIAESWDEDALEKGTVFFGGKSRGAIAHEQLYEPREPVKLEPCATVNCPGCDNCIPF